VDVVLVHDAARALVPPDLVARVARAVRSGHPAVIPGVPLTDTIKQIGLVTDSALAAAAADSVEDSVSGAGAPVFATVNRDRLRAVQTPQGFDRTLLDRAHAAGARRGAAEWTAATDDASLVEAIGVAVWLVEGERDAFKITTALDLALAELVLARSEPGADALSEAGPA
jgi:2-C-methyl-D-erythritol 4-phosphate cytidylyltransferase